MTNGAAVLADVVEEHFDEAEFLFELWSGTARSPQSNLAELQKTIEPRLIAHLDGLVVGGQTVAEDLLWPALKDDAETPALRAAAAALALLLEPGTAARDRLIDILRTTGNAALQSGLARAFKVSPRDDLQEPLRLAVYATETPTAQAALLGVLAARRIDPGPILGTLLKRTEPEVLAAALSAAAAAFSERARLRNLVDAQLAHADAPVRDAALRTALIWNLQTGWQACATMARAGSPQALLFLALLAGPRELRPVLEALSSAERRKAALFALGFSGQGEAVDACLPHLADPDPATAKLAAEAIAGITGLPLYDEPFTLPDKEEPEGAELPPLEEDLAKDLAQVAHDELPLPNAAEIRKWWSSKRGSLAASQRYVRGLVLSAASAQVALAEGALRRTGPLALEVAIRTGGRVQLPALRLGQAAPTLAADVAMHRPPGWT